MSKQVSPTMSRNSRQTRNSRQPGSSQQSLKPKVLSFEPIDADELERISEKGAWESIVSKYEIAFGKDAEGKPRNPPRIPLCRLMTMEAVRNLQVDSVEKLKVGFEGSGYVPKLSEFHITEFNEQGRSHTIDEFKADWDPIWTQLNEDFERECEAVEEFRVLKNKMFWIFDGNHRYTAWSRVAKEHPESHMYHPCVRFSLLDAQKTGFKRIEQAMHALNS